MTVAWQAASGVIVLGLGIGACAAPAISTPAPPLTGTRIAITVDDLPANGDLLPGTTRAGIARDIVDTLKRHGVPQVYGFATGQVGDPGLRDVADAWVTAGYPLGNHSFGHTDLNVVDTPTYIADIERMDGLLQTLLRGTSLTEARRVYRFPFLNEGNTSAKRQAIRDYLLAHGYRIAQVTVDYYDWAWNAAYSRCRTAEDDAATEWLRTSVVEEATRSVTAARAVSRLLFGRDVTHILLLHVGAFDAVMLDAILQELEAQGATFVTLDAAMADPAYLHSPAYTGDIGLTFLEQVAAERQVDISALEDTPYTIERLAAVCRGD